MTHDAKRLLKKYGLWNPSTLADFASVDLETAARWIDETEDLPAYIISLLDEMDIWNISEIKEYTPDMEACRHELFQISKELQSEADIAEDKKILRTLLKTLDKLNRQNMNAKRTFAR